MMTEREQQTILGPKSQIFLWIKFLFLASLLLSLLSHTVSKSHAD